jgi:hypothetical protein
MYRSGRYAVHGLADIGSARLGIVGEQFRALDGHAIVTMATVHRLLVKKYLL